MSSLRYRRENRQTLLPLVEMLVVSLGGSLAAVLSGAPRDGVWVMGEIPGPLHLRGHKAKRGPREEYRCPLEVCVAYLTSVLAPSLCKMRT